MRIDKALLDAKMASWTPELYDYTNQAWVVDGKYYRCGHPEAMACKCYGKIHEGEQADMVRLWAENGKLGVVTV